MSENVRCRACHGVGKPTIITASVKKPIKKCCYCNSINVVETKEHTVEPHWYSGPILNAEPLTGVLLNSGSFPLVGYRVIHR